MERSVAVNGQILRCVLAAHLHEVETSQDMLAMEALMTMRTAPNLAKMVLAMRRPDLTEDTRTPSDRLDEAQSLVSEFVELIVSGKPSKERPYEITVFAIERGQKYSSFVKDRAEVDSFRERMATLTFEELTAKMGNCEQFVPLHLQG